MNEKVWACRVSQNRIEFRKATGPIKATTSMVERSYTTDDWEYYISPDGLGHRRKRKVPRTYTLKQTRWEGGEVWLTCSIFMWDTLIRYFGPHTLIEIGHAVEVTHKLLEALKDKNIQAQLRVEEP